MPTVRYVGGPTAILEIGGARLLTDPTFDPPGEYPIGSRKLTKTTGPALRPDEMGPIDVVLLSHDQHPDNLDRLGRAHLERASRVLSTASAFDRIGAPIEALPSWEQVDVEDSDGLKITAVPALHGPPGSESLVGEVTGFVINGDDIPTVYVSGDNASLDIVREVSQRFASIDVAVLFAGGAKTPLLGQEFLTLSSEQAVEATQILGATHVVPLHFEHWAHFTQGADTLRAAFASSDVADRLRLLTPGESINLSPR